MWFLGERNALNSRFAWTFGPKNEGTAQGINKIDDTGVFAHFEILRKAKLTKKSFLYWTT